MSFTSTILMMVSTAASFGQTSEACNQADYISELDLVTPVILTDTAVDDNESPRRPALADFNGDGEIDIAVPFAGDSVAIAVYLGNGDGTFGAASTYSVASSPRSIAVGDLDNDGELDIVSGNFATGSSTISILFGVGDGTFSTPFSSVTDGDSQTLDIDLADVDSDDDLDILATNNNTSGAFRVYLNDGMGGFGSASYKGTTSDASRRIDVGDINADGDIDVVLAGSSGSSTFNGIIIYLGDGSGGFANRVFAVSVSAANVLRGVELADFDEDGDADVIALNGGSTTDSADDSFSIFIGDGSGGVGSPSTFTVGDQPLDMLVTDLDCDGHLDVLTTNIFRTLDGEEASLRFGNGDGTFQSELNFTIGEESRGVASAMIDENSSPDLVITSINNSPPPSGSGDGMVSVYLSGCFKMCDEDLDGNGVVDSNDLGILLAAWGNCPPAPSECPSDLNGDGEVGSKDLGILVAAYGICD